MACLRRELTFGGSHKARLGGSILVKGLVMELERHDLVTPHGLIPSVGYVGWATHGGYGLLSAQYGLSADQILEARVVDREGRIRNAVPDMLTVIRGAGGLLGVIVDVTIKVYLMKQFEGDDLPSTLRLYQSVMNGPGEKALTVLFSWTTSDIECGLSWLSKVKFWSPVAACTV
ncbi:hypothetical protein AnigIFM59636_004438 [Aspergillus niger]|nr:hypothetical protein AnigIFM59636_004438 [Aspergillus niger]